MRKKENREKRPKKKVSLKRMKAVIKETLADLPDLSKAEDLGPQDLLEIQDLIDLQNKTFEISQRY